MVGVKIELKELQLIVYTLFNNKFFNRKLGKTAPFFPAFFAYNIFKIAFFKVLVRVWSGFGQPLVSHQLIEIIGLVRVVRGKLENIRMRVYARARGCEKFSNFYFRADQPDLLIISVT